VKMHIRADRRDEWLEGVVRYAEAVRAEPGAPDFECHESVERPNHFVAVEGFASREASDGHVQTEHFKEFIGWVPKMLAEAPQIINVEVDGWSLMSELAQ
ncbi:MAG TPA: putative quinol monooxygenase, partial [Candidatus Dormibacteraeota bacterium]|nr:putative quinol monooxygenase [Candidatus Dormibacteraeota bacterium]